MKTIGNVLLWTVLAIAGLALVGLSALLAYEYFQLVGAIVAGILVLGIEIVCIIYREYLSDTMLVPSILLAVIVFAGYWGWQLLKWIYVAALIPLGQAYVTLVAGMIAMNPTSWAIAVPLGIAVFCLLLFIGWRIVVWMKNR